MHNSNPLCMKNSPRWEGHEQDSNSKNNSRDKLQGKRQPPGGFMLSCSRSSNEICAFPMDRCISSLCFIDPITYHSQSRKKSWCRMWWQVVEERRDFLVPQEEQSRHYRAEQPYWVNQRPNPWQIDLKIESAIWWYGNSIIHLHR